MSVMRRGGSDTQVEYVGTLVQLLSQPPEGAACPLPAAMDDGEFMDGEFESNKTAYGRWELHFMPRTWGNKASMKSLQHYTKQCRLTVL